MKYNPLKLPKRIDFHLATQDLPLPRESKSRIQIALSKMTGTQLNRLIKELAEMRYDALKRQDYKMAAYCKSVKEFTEKYFYSTKKQKKVGDKY